MLTAALGLVGVEVLVMIGFAVLSATDVLAVSAGEQVTVVTLTVVLIGLAALLGAAALALWRGRRWGRGPVVTWQLLLILIGISGVSGAPWWGSGLLVGWGVVVIAGVLAKPTREWLLGGGAPEALI